ncbi:MAG: MFS transporter [Candidatus Peribacteraceae bacterium]|nr:MFS transporter [Candidatus Peribacteraceae bacterium]
MTTTASRRNLLLWLLYDFGNSFVTLAITGLYLGQWLILDNKIDDIWYGASFAVGTIIVLIVSPLLGAWSDSLGRRKPFLIWMTAGLLAAEGLMALTILLSYPLPSRAFIVLGIVVFIQCFYQLSLVFHNALLRDLSTEQSRGAISGLGETVNELGWIVAAAAFIPFASGTLIIVGTPGRAQIFLPACILSAVFCLPFILWFHETPKTHIMASATTGLAMLRRTSHGIRQLFSEHRNVGLFLLSFALMSDIVLTLHLYFAIVMDALYHIDDTMKSLILIITGCCMVIFSWFFGRMADRFGNKPILFFSCILLILWTVIFFSSSDPKMLFATALLGGMGGGGYSVVSRSMMASISPPDRQGEYFGFFSTFQRFASIVGPLLWGIIVFSLRDTATLKYRAAGTVMIVLLILGTILLLWVRDAPRGPRAEVIQ